MTGHIDGIRDASASAAGIRGPGFCPCVSVAQYLTGSFSALPENLPLGLKLFCLVGCCFVVVFFLLVPKRLPTPRQSCSLSCPYFWAVVFIPGSLSCIWPITSESLQLRLLESRFLHTLSEGTVTEQHACHSYGHLSLQKMVVCM